MLMKNVFSVNIRSAIVYYYSIYEPCTIRLSSDRLGIQEQHRNLTFIYLIWFFTGYLAVYLIDDLLLREETRKDSRDTNVLCLVISKSSLAPSADGVPNTFQFHLAFFMNYMSHLC